MDIRGPFSWIERQRPPEFRRCNLGPCVLEVPDYFFLSFVLIRQKDRKGNLTQGSSVLSPGSTSILGSRD